jgi:hypothetical protein
MEQPLSIIPGLNTYTRKVLHVCPPQPDEDKGRFVIFYSAHKNSKTVHTALVPGSPT